MRSALRMTSILLGGLLLLLGGAVFVWAVAGSPLMVFLGEFGVWAPSNRTLLTISVLLIIAAVLSLGMARRLAH